MDSLSFWQKRKTRVYNELLLGKYNVPELDYALKEVGLPILKSEYHNFQPIDELTLLNENQIILGFPFKGLKSALDNMVIFDLSDKHIYFHSRAFYEIGFAPKPITPMNSSIDSFFYFNKQIIEYVECFLDTDDVENVIAMFKKMVLDLKSYDTFGFGGPNDHYLLWRKRLTSLETDIEEHFDESVFIDDILFSTGI